VTDHQRGPVDVPALTVTPTTLDPVHDCELCRALLALAESAVANRAAADEDDATDG
jgi:hypothetical protein